MAPGHSDGYQVSADGVMLLARHDVRELLARFGSPLVVLQEEIVRAQCQAYSREIGKAPLARVYYAAKAFLTTGFCRLIEQEGLGLDVSSGGELATALSAWFPPERILMHGNAKTVPELELALAVGVSRIVIDNFAEIDRLDQLAAQADCHPRVLIRVTPGIKPATHAYVQTGQVDSKFGFNLGQDPSAPSAAEEAARRVLASARLRLGGLHCHIGSQIFDAQPFETAARTLMAFYAHLQQDLGANITELNMGGGLGIGYQPSDQPLTVAAHLETLRTAVLQAATALSVEAPELSDEPGRSIVGPAGITLYTVQSTKQIPGVRNYAAVDGGMTDNPRHALYQARHPVLAATRLHEAADTLWSISGRCCESGDMLAKDVALPGLQSGDVLAVLATGAYTYSMASNYNRVQRPAVVLAGPGRVDLLARRQTPEDLLRLDHIPAWLRTGDTPHES